MTKFNSLNEMIEAYKAHYNSNCSHDDEFLSSDDVKEVCVERFLIPFAAAVGIKLNSHSYRIDGFGYVAA